jgi:methyl-accepting chemotaxis protein
VGRAINQMDEVTQQNAALVEEAAAAAESLRGQAQRLALAVAAFHLGAEVVPALGLAPANTVAARQSGLRLPGEKKQRAAALTADFPKKMLAANVSVPSGQADDWAEF